MTRTNEAPGLDRGVERPVWYLDVDGTLSPYGLTEPWPGPTLYRAPADSDFAVPYRPDVIKAIQRLHDQGLVEVRWLTTWDAEALADWANVGLGPFRAITRYKAPHNMWWKAHAVRDWLHKHPNGHAIWTDDDISTGQLRGLDRTRLLAITPDHTVGLTDRDIARIEGWAVRHQRYAQDARRDAERDG